MPRTLTALYDTASLAEAARDRLIHAGIPASEIDVHDQAAYGEPATDNHKGGMLAGLKSMFGAHEDHHAYSEGLSRGHVLLNATVGDGETEKAYEILDESGAVDFDQSQAQWRQAGWSGAQSEAPSTNDTIQLAEERLVIGRREVERGGIRVRSYVVETPVSEQVNLRQETVGIERHPVNRPVAAGDEAFRNRTLEMRETSEEAVVGKETFVTEEIALRKDVGQRTEEVRDSVRHTEVEVEHVEGASAPTQTDPVAPRN